MATENFQNDNYNFTIRNPWFSSFLGSTNPNSRKSWLKLEQQVLEHRVNWETYIRYARAVVMLLYIDKSFPIVKNNLCSVRKEAFSTGPVNFKL